MEGSNVGSQYSIRTICPYVPDFSVFDLLRVKFFFCLPVKYVLRPVLLLYYIYLQGMKMKKHEELETPTFTTSIPIEISSED